MTGENFKRFHYCNKKKTIITISKSKEREIRSEIQNLRNQLDKEYLDLNIPDEYLNMKETKINKLLDKLYQ
jgi:hypothetical protein